jgi:release factor glutamine methyltransferase
MESQVIPPNDRAQLRLADVVIDGARRLLAAGIESARLDAELLLGHVLHESREGLLSDARLALGENEQQRYQHLLARRIEREPVAYITGRQEFWSREFRVTPDVLIPRPETECLVEIALKLAGDWREPLKILDLGTGSGAIAVALAGELPTAEIFATDISPAALTVAQLNAAENGVPANVRFLDSDLFGALAETRGKFHLIVSNPPYIRRGDIASLAPEVGRWEPRSALDGGIDGLDYYRCLADESFAYLRPDGAVIMEIGADMADAVKALFRKARADVEIYPDYSGRDRVVVARFRGATKN